MVKGQFDIAWRGALFKDRDIWGICADTFEFGTGRFFQMHQILDQMDIVVENSVLIMFNQE